MYTVFVLPGKWFTILTLLIMLTSVVGYTALRQLNHHTKPVTSSRSTSASSTTIVSEITGELPGPDPGSVRQSVLAILLKNNPTYATVIREYSPAIMLVGKTHAVINFQGPTGFNHTAILNLMTGQLTEDACLVTDELVDVQYRGDALVCIGAYQITTYIRDEAGFTELPGSSLSSSTSETYDRNPGDEIGSPEYTLVSSTLTISVFEAVPGIRSSKLRDVRFVLP